MTGKISELTALTGASVATDDQFEIRDTSAGTSGSKSITVAELRKGVFSREILSASRNYYVRTDGSDANNGLTDTAGGAWLTLQHAYIWLCENIDAGAFVVTVHIAAGTYDGFDSYDPANYPDYDVNRVFVSGSLTFSGNVATPANVIIQGTVIVGYCVSVIVASGVSIIFEGITFDINGQYTAITKSGDGFIIARHYRVINASGADIFYLYSGELVAQECHEIVGNFNSFMYIFGPAAFGWFFQYVNTLVFTGSPVIGDAFVVCSTGGCFFTRWVANSGTITGKKYRAVGNAVLDINGRVLPGSVSGTTATGAQVT